MTRLTLFLTHGWSYDASFWDKLLQHFTQITALRSDDGYYGTSFIPPLPQCPYWAIGHSAGVMQLLGRPLPGCLGLVAINGFARFSRNPDFPNGVPGRILARMRHQITHNAQHVLTDFRALCGDTASPPPPSCNSSRLKMGLEQLEKGDYRASLAHIPMPLYSITGRYDPLLPARHGLTAPAKSFCLEGGHLLPLTHAAECAALIQHIITAP